MSCTRAIYTRLHGEPPLPVTTTTEQTEQPSTRWGALLGLALAVATLAGIALVVLGVAYGGAWRVASAAAVVAGVAAIVVPGFVKDKQDSGNEETK